MRAPYRGVRQLTADVDETLPGRGVVIIATVAGNVNLKFVDGSKIALPVAVGRTEWDDVQLVGYTASGTTATATVFNKI